MSSFLRILGPIPRQCYIAVSGGVDSMVLLSFVLRGRSKVEVLYMHHGTEFGGRAAEFVRDYCQYHNLRIHIGNLASEYHKGSKEKFWREERYGFLGEKRFQDRPILMAHNLDDVVEWWFMSAAQGKPSLIPYRRDNIIRPLLLNSKAIIREYADRFNIPFTEDPSNTDRRYRRNYYRWEVIPRVLEYDPGMYTSIRRLVQEEYNSEQETNKRSF